MYILCFIGAISIRNQALEKLWIVYLTFCLVRLASKIRAICNVNLLKDVFRYLFRDRGTKPTRGLGKLNQTVDFSEHVFSSEWDKVYDRLGDGCQVEFPIRMHSKLRLSSIVYTQGEDGMLVHKQQSFSEVFVLNVVKKHF